MPKTVLLAGIFCCLSLFGFTQLLTTSPNFPRDNSSLSIIADMSKGNQGLLNYNGEVYIHIGVILGNNPSPWDSVKFAWGTANALAKATSLGNNKYQFNIPNIRSFFNVPANVPIRKVALLFRDAAGNQVQRNADGSDLYINVYNTAQAVKFIQPPFEPRFGPIPEPINKISGEAVDIHFVSNNPADLKLFLNGNEIKSVANDTVINHSIILSGSGTQEIIGHATNGAITVADTVRFFIAPPVSIAPLPSGVRDGINYEPGDTSAILVLTAPFKNRVALIGDFNNWSETPASQLKKTPDARQWWIRLTGLTPGTEYAYQYLVDNSLRIADPYTQKVLDESNDPFIPAETYPNLKPYPTGKTTGIVSIVQTAEVAYTWQVNNFSRPDKKGLIIYELLLRDFVAAHNWQTLKDTLSYLKRLGINAIELMPINEFEGNISWGYNPSFYFAPDKYYGTKNKLKEFIDACHQQGIAVILDIALNHSFGQSPMVQLYFSNGRPDAQSPWYNPYTKHAFNVGYDMNHQSAATQYFTGRVVEHWLQEYKIDGFRFDLSKGFTQVNTCDATGNNCDVGRWGEYDTSRINLWKRYYDTVQLKSSGAFVILEHFADNTEERILSDYGMLLWGNANGAYTDASRGVATANFESALFTVRGFTSPHLISYMESHDEERLMVRNKQEGLSSGSYNIRDLNTALRRSEMAAAFYLTLPGPKMIWQFGETGYDFSINHCPNGTTSNNCRTDPKPIRWDYMADFNRRRLYEVNAALLKLRVHSLYRDGFVSNRITNQLSTPVKWLKLNTDTSNLMVIGNFDVTSATAQVVFPNAGTWYDYLTGQTITATGSAQSITLQPGEYHVYLNRNITNILTPVGDLPSVFENFSLRVYPNPVQPNTLLEWELPETSQVNIFVVNLAGQTVKQLFNGVKPKGMHTLAVTGINNLSTGTYFIKLQTSKASVTSKVIIQ